MKNLPESNKLINYIKSKDIELSFELFPPKTTSGVDNLKQDILELSKLSPEYFSVTYGAGGTTKENTYEIVKFILEKTNINAAPHLTCVGTSKEYVAKLIEEYKEINVNHLVALRGDTPNMEGEYIPDPDGYAYAYDLVEGIQSMGKYKISVAAYPEIHPQALSAQGDMDNLKRKEDAGADEAITQYCFDTNTILDFINKARNNNIAMPIIPGIVLINNFEQLTRFSARCGASIPDWLKDLFQDTSCEKEELETLSTYVTIKQIHDLVKNGFTSFHLYTLNDKNLTKKLCDAIK